MERLLSPYSTNNSDVGSLDRLGFASRLHVDQKGVGGLAHAGCNWKNN